MNNAGKVPRPTPGTRTFSPVLVEPMLEHEPRRRRTALLLCLFLGWLGIHRFYLGKRSSGRLYLWTSGLLGLGVVVDLARILSGSMEDRFGRPLV